MNRKIVLILLLVCFLSSCETIVEVDLPKHEPRLVVNAFFNPDSTWFARLYKSKDILEDGRAQLVANATVQIKSGDSTVATLYYKDTGPNHESYYKSPSDSKPQVGQPYTLIAEAPGLPPVSATEVIPAPVPVNAAEGRVARSSIDVTVRFTDPPGKNYYQILVLQDLGGGNLSPIHFNSEDLIFQDIDGAHGGEALFDDALIANQTYSLKLETFTSRFGQEGALYVALLSLSEAYYKYHKTVDSQDDNDDSPFGAPVQVYNNIENGLGIFAGYSSSLMRVEM